MRWGGPIGFAFALTTVAGMAKGQATSDELLTCAAEFSARATYAETLGHSDAGHIGFLRGRSDIFLRLGEGRAPQQVISCGDSGWLISLVLCLGPADLVDEREELASQRLIEIVEVHRGIYQLPACIVDDTCADCMALFNRVVREQYPLAWQATSP